MDAVNQTDGLYVGFDGYGVYYPYDAFLVVAANELDAENDVALAQQMSTPEYKGAVVVKIVVTENYND